MCACMHAGAQVICRMMVSLKEESQHLTGLLSFSAQTPNVEIYSGILNRETSVQQLI